MIELRAVTSGRVSLQLFVMPTLSWAGKNTSLILRVDVGEGLQE